jgi:hypothetical protein
MPAGGHATPGADTRRLHVDVITSSHELLEKPLSHRAAADIAGANKKDTLHEQFLKMGASGSQVNRASRKCFLVATKAKIGATRLLRRDFDEAM